MVESATSPKPEEKDRIHKAAGKALAHQLIDLLQNGGRNQEEIDEDSRFILNLLAERDAISSGRTINEGSRRMQIYNTLSQELGNNLPNVEAAWRASLK